MHMASRVLGIVSALGVLTLVSCTGTEAATPTAPEVLADAPTEVDAQAAPVVAAETVLPESPIQADFLFLASELTQGGYVRGRAPSGTVSLTLDEQEIALGEDGVFFAAFDRDSPASVTLTASSLEGPPVREELSLTTRDWQIERVNVAKRNLRNPEAYWRQREPEYNAIVAARAKETGAQGWKQDFIWPVQGRISGRFGRQRIYRGEPGSYHSGIDIAKPTGTPFVAPADGVVILARTGFSLEGGLLMIDHGNGLNSAFLHCHRIHVKEGDTVRQGQHIGDIGATGRATGPHLHWGLKWHEARIDPILLAGPMN